MNVSSVNSVSFGSVKKSAVENAVKQANGDVGELARIKNLVEEQQSNTRYDVEGLPSHEYYSYIVTKSGENSGQCFHELREACGFANRAKQKEEWDEKKQADKQAQQPAFDKLADETLSDCE